MRAFRKYSVESMVEACPSEIQIIIARGKVDSALPECGQRLTRIVLYIRMSVGKKSKELLPSVVIQQFFKRIVFADGAYIWKKYDVTC